MMKFSFVIPTYNCKNLVQSSIEALNLLKDTNDFCFEVILIDDGSTDNTGEYFKNKSFPFDLKYIYLERCDISSRSRARNYGIEASQGDYIIFIDADIIVQPDYLLELYRYFIQMPNNVVIGQRLFLDHIISPEAVHDKNFFSPYKIENCSRKYAEFRHIIFHKLSYNMACLTYPFLLGQTCNIAYLRSDLVKAGGFDESMIAWGIEDIELAYRIFKSGRNFSLNPKMYVLHQFHGCQETLFVTHDKLEGIKKNTDIFFRKHPEALPLSIQDAYLFFMNLAARFYDVEKKTADDNPVIAITLKEPVNLEYVKKQILEYSSKKQVNLLVYDYLENCDLDLWIQQLGKRNSTPLYYPMSLYSYINTENVSDLFRDNLLISAP